MSANFVSDEQPEGEQTMRGVVGGTKLFNRFVLQKVLGRGGMGVVWLARDERLDRFVALKLVPESVCFDPSAHEDLKRETRKSLMLTHPNIVRIFDFIEDERSAGISMEYVDGATLSSLRVKRPTKCFEVDEIAAWTLSLCDALTYAHESAHLVHRDLKPSNLMVNSKQDLKITDFGIACTLRDSMTCVSMHTSSGTLNYMSPQQLLGEDPASSDDVYAVGATLYEMLSSKPPFFGGDVASQVREVIPPTIAQRRAKFGIKGASIPKYWEETIAGCLAKNPEQRPRTASDIARRLRLSGPVRLRKSDTERKNLVAAIATVVKKLDRRALLAGAAALLLVAGLAALHFGKKAEPTADKLNNATPTVRYAIEKTVPDKSAKPPEPSVAPQTSLLPAEASHAVEPVAIAAPPRKIASKNGTIQLTTTPGGATFSIYPGVIANKTAPAVDPMRNGTTPGAIEDLPPGRYTLFFHNEGWPDDRAEITLNAGESVPVDYTFPHGTANITSTPTGAEIFLGTKSLGTTPVSVELPLGKLKLTARLSNSPDRTQAATISSQMTANIGFDMTAHRSLKPKATPPPSALDKFGQTLKHVFGGKSPTPAPRKKH